MEERPAIWRVAANILNKQKRAADKRWSSSLGTCWARCYQLLTVKTYQITKHKQVKPRTLTDTLERHKQRKRGMRFGTWNVRSLYRVGSPRAAVRELVRYKLDLVGVQEVKWENGGTVRAGDYNFLYGKGK